MDATLLNGLQDELCEDLKAELKDDSNFDADILKSKIKNAIRDVMLRRNYTATAYNDESIAKDMASFYSVIRSVALYDYNQIGAEGQQSHSENTVSRSWVDRNSLFNGVIPFVKIL